MDDVKEKRAYTTPKAVIFAERIQNGVPGALYGAALMVGRALVKAMKGGIDMTAGADSPKILQQKK